MRAARVVTLVLTAHGSADPRSAAVTHAVAGRIRRLLAMADRRAEELGVPDTESAITPDMLDWAGRWTPVIYAAVPALAAVLGAYIKRDPDREVDSTPAPDDYEPKH